MANDTTKGKTVTITIESVRVQDLKPGDIIDCANYKYLNRAVWREVVQVKETADGRYAIQVTARGTTYWHGHGLASNAYDLFDCQRSNDV